MSEVASIPLLGLEERLSQRYRADGLCETLHNVRPQGIEQSVRWKPVNGVSDFGTVQLLPEAKSRKVFKIYVNTGIMNDGSDYSLTTLIPNESKDIIETITVNDTNISNASDLCEPLINALNNNPSLNNYIFIGEMETTPVDNKSHYSITIEGKEITNQTNVGNCFLGLDGLLGTDAIVIKDESYESLVKPTNVESYNNFLGTYFDIDGGNANPSGNINNIHWQIRSYRNNDFTIDPNSSLNRLVASYDDQILLLEEHNNTLKQTVSGYELGDWVESVSFVTNQNNILILLKGNNQGEILWLIDDYFISTKTPVLPKININTSVVPDGETEDPNHLKRGTYGMRIAYRLSNGDLINLSEPVPITLGSGLTFNDTNSKDLVDISIEKPRVPYTATKWKNIITGITVLMTPKIHDGYIDAAFGPEHSEYIEAMGDSLYYEIKDIPFSETTDKYTQIEIKESEIETHELASTDILNANHEIYGRNLYVYNGRFILGQTIYDFSTPDYNPTKVPRILENPPNPEVTDDPRGDYKILFIVEIETDRGVFYRKLPKVDVYNYDLREWLTLNPLWYPDVRCKKIWIFDGYVDNSFTKAQFYVNMNSSYKGGYSYGTINDLKDYFGDFLLSDINVSRQYIDISQINASELNAPYSFRAKNTYHVGNGNEPVLAFASNALPVSEGQFGQYPLYVFTDKSIWSLSVGGTDGVLFQNISPVSLRRGVLSADAVANIDQIIVFASEQGIYALSGGSIDYIGGPVENTVREHISNLKIATVNESEHQEVFVSAGTKTLVYNTRYNTWYTRDGGYDRILERGDITYYLSNDKIGKTDQSTLLPIIIKTHPIDFEAYDYRKKLHNTHVRNSIDMANPATYTLTYDFKDKLVPVYSGSKSEFRTKFGSAFGFIVDIEFSPTSEDEFIEMIQMEYDYKYARKIRN